MAQAPLAGTSIGNKASATYTDGSNVTRTAQSNTVTTLVQQVAGVDLTDPRALRSAPAAPIYFPHTVENIGNGPDRFNLSLPDGAGTLGLQLFPDVNGDGRPDSSDVVAVSPTLQPGQKYSFVVGGRIPNAATSGTVFNHTVRSESVLPGGSFDVNADSVTVSNNAIISVRKSTSVDRGLPGTSTIYTIRYTNNSSVASGAVVLTDVLNSNLTYTPNSGVWNIGGNQPLSDDGADPAGIDYSVVGNTITATIASVPAGSEGSISFGVTVNAGAQPGVIPNSVDVSYDDDNDGSTPLTPVLPPPAITANVPDRSNTANFNVTQRAALTYTGETIGTRPQGATVVFTNPLVNRTGTVNGSGTDTYDIVFGGNTFPAGTTFELYQNDGVTPLLDTDNDRIPDTGPVAPGATYNVIVRAILPPGASGNNNGAGFTVDTIATSSADTSVTQTAVDKLDAIGASAMDLSNVLTGVGPFVPGDPATFTASGAPGTTQRIPLRVSNTAGATDSYILTVASQSPGVGALPDGYTVTFRDGDGAVISNVRDVPSGGFVDVFADVFIPLGAPNGSGIDLFFTARSATTNSTDNLFNRVNVGSVRSIRVEDNNAGQVFLGSSVTYSHTLTNTGNTLETDIAVEVTGDANGFASVVYLDADGNGLLDGTEAVTPLTTIPSLAAGASTKLIVKVFGPQDDSRVGQTNATLLRVTGDGDLVTDGFQVGGPTDTDTDTTTLVIGDIRLDKEQSVGGGAFTRASGSAAPGAVIRYRITVVNTGAAPVRNVIVTDRTPAYTIYDDGAAAGEEAGFTKGGVFTAISPVLLDGENGLLTFNVGDLNPGETVTVTFGVRVRNRQEVE